MPGESSGEFLTEYSRFGNDKYLNLLEQLELSGDNRIVDAWRATQRESGRGNGRRRRELSASEPLRRKIASDLLRAWPELANQSAPDAEKQKVKYERFLRTADNVVLAENLKRLDDKNRIAQYNEIVAAELKQ